MIIELAGCIIKDNRGGILLLHRNNGKYLQWEIPGGKVDPGEKPNATAAREVKEELGIEVTIEEQLGEKEFVQGEQTMHYTWYLARILTGEPRVMEPETFDKLAYFKPDEAKKMYNELSPNAQNFINMLGRIKL